MDIAVDITGVPAATAITAPAAQSALAQYWLDKHSGGGIDPTSSPSVPRSIWAAF